MRDIGSHHGLLTVVASLLIAALGAPPAQARRRYRSRKRVRRPVRHLRTAMRVADLPPTWSAATRGMEVAIDGEDEPVPGPIRIKSTRARLKRIACYQALRSRGVRFKPGPTKGGLIAYPVIVTHPIQGVHYKDKYLRKSMLADCQLVLGLYRAAAIFRRHGIVKVLYSNTWRPPYWSFKRRRSMPARGRRMGHHPRGLAMDASVFIHKNGTKYEVQPDWEKYNGGPGNCVGRVKTAKGRKLRKLICAMEKAHIFRRILTPDSDWGHRHHFHIGAAQINQSFVRARWAGRTLNQPLPGSRKYGGWYRWYSCYKIRNVRKRWRCYRRRRRLKARVKTPIRYKRPRQKPRAAIRLVIPEPVETEPPRESRAVDPDKGSTKNARPRPRRRPKRPGGRPKRS